VGWGLSLEGGADAGRGGSPEDNGDGESEPDFS
jgi:hypothetical protein